MQNLRGEIDLYQYARLKHLGIPSRCTSPRRWLGSRSRPPDPWTIQAVVGGLVAYAFDKAERMRREILHRRPRRGIGRNACPRHRREIRLDPADEAGIDRGPLREERGEGVPAEAAEQVAQGRSLRHGAGVFGKRRQRRDDVLAGAAHA